MPVKGLPVPATMHLQGQAVFQKTEVLVLLNDTVGRGATKLWRARGAEMRVHGPLRPYLSMQAEIAVEVTEIAGMRQVQLGSVMSMSGLMSVAEKCGAKAIRGLRPSGMMTSMFWALGLHLCVLARPEMFRSCAAHALGVGEKIASVLVSKNRRAEGNWTARVADQRGLASVLGRPKPLQQMNSAGRNACAARSTAWTYGDASEGRVKREQASRSGGMRGA